MKVFFAGNSEGGSDRLERTVLVPQGVRRRQLSYGERQKWLVYLPYYRVLRLPPRARPT